MVKLILIVIVLLVFIAGCALIWYAISEVLRKRRAADEDRTRRLNEETLWQLNEMRPAGYTPGETIPKEFRSGVQR